ncbi:MAG: long-chain fatty acid--CoA ligase, partial [Acidobacteria bacterium]
MLSTEFATLNELFLKAVAKHDKPDCFLAKSEGRYRSVASREALGKVAVLASGFARLGVERGDRVAILSENRVEWALTDYAILGLGAITVPVYPTLPEPDIEFILEDSGAKVIVVSTEVQLRKVLNIRSRLPGLRFVLVMDAAEDTASIIYTSGTMGQPKGVVLTHANIASNIRACQSLFPLENRDVGMSILPLSHVLERMLDYVFLWDGVTIAYPESFEALPQNLLEVRPTVMAVVPRVLEKIYAKVMEKVRRALAVRQRLFHWAVGMGKEYFPYQLRGRTAPLGPRLKRAVADALVFSKVRAQLGGRIRFLISGAAPLSRELAEFFFVMGLPVYEGYGLTETSPVVAVNYPGHVRLGTVGRVIPGVEVKLGEEVDLEDGSSGREILVRGPNVTAGYYHLEEENRGSFVDGWFRTGDLGSLDADGFLSITGRRKNLFKTSGGKFVSPEKLENLFQGHPYVHQIVVLGAARKFVGALVVPNFERLEAYARSQGFAFK